ncbi:MAG: c-type cytochrome, partial [Verrucomicrobiales bacterium]
MRIHSLQLIILALIAQLALASGENRGAAIYKSQCAECHGNDGQGVPGEYDDPLVGDRSIKSLAKLIERTMPEQDESLCVGDDAAAVAAFIHGAFYSAEAREQLGLTPDVRVELARRTVPQYRNAIADIIASVDPNRTKPDYQTGGLRGSYFSSDKMSKKHKRGLDRTDEVINFDFKEEPPAEGIDPTQFSIAWEGSLVAPATGTYE